MEEVMDKIEQANRESKYIYKENKRHQQQSTNSINQAAQERIKRLQRNLKRQNNSINKKEDEDNVAPKRTTRFSNLIPATSSSKSSKQAAQERIKRLQRNLKRQDNSINKKENEDNVAPKRTTRFSNLIPATSSSVHVTRPIVAKFMPKVTSAVNNKQQSRSFVERPKNSSLPDKSKHVQRLPLPVKNFLPGKVLHTGLPVRKDFTARSESGFKNAWAKPEALLNASNRLEANCSIGANQRLSLLRELLQQQQKERQGDSNTNDNTNNNKPYVDIEMKQLAVTTNAPKIVEIKPLPVVEQSNDDEEPMDIDWPEDAKEEDATSSITLREDNSDLTLFQQLSNEGELPSRLTDHMYFVLDTNVLLDDLMFVEDLTRLALRKTKGSMLYIPYIVIKELDKLKDKRREDNEQIRTVAMRAIRYLNKKFDSSLKIQAQSALEELDHWIDVDCPDDSILNCCLQLQDQVPNLMLLTNDANLRLKANASSVQVSCPSDLKNEHREDFDALPT